MGAYSINIPLNHSVHCCQISLVFTLVHALSQCIYRDAKPPVLRNQTHFVSLQHLVPLVSPRPPFPLEIFQRICSSAKDWVRAQCLVYSSPQYKTSMESSSLYIWPLPTPRFPCEVEVEAPVVPFRRLMGGSFRKAGAFLAFSLVWAEDVTLERVCYLKVLPERVCSLYVSVVQGNRLGLPSVRITPHYPYVCCRLLFRRWVH